MSFDIEDVKNRSIELLEYAQTLSNNQKNEPITFFHISDLGARAAQLISSVTGSKSIYSENIKHAQREKLVPNARFMAVVGVIQAFHLDLVKGRLKNIRHEVETVVISEIVTQAKHLLKAKGIHPAASVMVCCAGLEEFLRSWCEESVIAIPEKQKSISKYALELRVAGHIVMPEERRIQSWADYRNNAAHGDKWSSITKEIAESLVNEVENFLVKYKEVLG